MLPLECKFHYMKHINAIYHYDLICVSGTYLDSSISNYEKDISVKVVRAYVFIIKNQ